MTSQAPVPFLADVTVVCHCPSSERAKQGGSEMKIFATAALSAIALATTLGLAQPAAAHSGVGGYVSDVRYDRYDYERDNWSADRWRHWCRHHRREHHLCDRWNNSDYRNDDRYDRYDGDRYRRDDYDQNWSADQWRDWCRYHRREHGLCDRWNY